MYKFTNGIVVYDEATKNRFEKAGYKLIPEKIKKEKDEESNNDEYINKEYSRGNIKDSKNIKQHN